MTSIEWTDATWNPVTGCQKVSPGCKNCYAERIADRFWGKRKFTDVRTISHRLNQPLRRKTPTMYFVNSMSDLFHEAVPFDFIIDVFRVMNEAKQHTFQVLTKRPERMLAFFEWVYGKDLPLHIPIQNVWLGVSVESQKYADERIPLLLKTPAAVRFISAEPLLEAISLDREVLRVIGWQGESRYPFPNLPDADRTKWLDRLDWVIVGGESGPGARPFQLSWADSLMKQCRAANVACFVKQVGSNPYDGEGSVRSAFKDGKGGNMDEWPEWLRLREFPQSQAVSA